MDVSPFTDGLISFAPAWVALVVLVSVFVRRSRGKPIFPKVPANGLDSERKASGRWASNCLIVAITPEAIIVTPRFPLNLTFLPEIYGLEHNIPRSDVSHVEGKKSWASNVAISLRNGHTLRLKVHQPASLIAQLACSVFAGGPVPVTSQRSEARSSN